MARAIGRPILTLRDGAHWLAMYRNFFPGAPPLEMRVMTKDRRCGELANDMPNFDGYSVKFMWRLVAAWIAMGLRRPDIALGKTVRKPH